MKRISRIFLILMLGFLVPLLTASGQEKKNEQKIKVIVVDDSGNRTVIDTTFTGDKFPEAITLKDGRVINITKAGIGLSHFEGDTKGKKIHVMVSSDLEDGKETAGKVIIMSSDSAKWTLKPSGTEKGQVYVYSHASAGNKPEKQIIIASAGDKPEEWHLSKSVTISDGKVIKSEDGKTFSVMISDNDEESDSNTTKYIFAKDGVVVTIESDDEAKAMEIKKMIESKLGEKNEKETPKTDTKKTEKK